MKLVHMRICCSACVVQRGILLVLLLPLDVPPSAPVRVGDYLLLLLLLQAKSGGKSKGADKEAAKAAKAKEKEEAKVRSSKRTAVQQRSAAARCTGSHTAAQTPHLMPPVLLPDHSAACILWCCCH
jgi:hypothetical protein